MPEYAIEFYAVGPRNVSSAPPPLAMTLNFAGGASASFSQASATDIGTYNGLYVQQRNLRQRAKDQAFGDFRDAFTVFFRPDTNGNRYEVVIEYGTEYDIPVNYPTSGPTTHSGQAAKHIRTATDAVTGATTNFISQNYTATITGGNIVGSIVITVPRHPWGSRWRWNSKGWTGGSPNTANPSGRPLPGDVGAIDATWAAAYTRLNTMKAIPPMSAVDQGSGGPIYGATPAVYGQVSYTPMGTGELDLYIADFGDRPELGFITEPQAGAVLDGDNHSSYAQSMMVNAEASGTVHIHARDAATNAPINIQTYHYLCLYPDNDSNGLAATTHLPMVPRGGIFINSCFNLNDDVTAHMYPLAFIPYLLTDDPYYLEELQAWAQLGMMWTNLSSVGYTGVLGSNSFGLVDIEVANQDLRAVAWALRDLCRACIFSPHGVASNYPVGNAVPGWILPGEPIAAGTTTYWGKCVANNLFYCHQYPLTQAGTTSLANPDGVAAGTTADTTVTFFCGPIGNVFVLAGFELDYMVIVLGWIVWSALFDSNWLSVLNYQAVPLLALHDNTSTVSNATGSGWDCRYPQPYYAQLFGNPATHSTEGGSGWGAPYTASYPDYGLQPEAAAGANATNWNGVFNGYQAWSVASNGGTATGTWPALSQVSPQFSADLIALPGVAYCAWARGALSMLELAGASMPTQFTTTATIQSEEIWVRKAIQAAGSTNWTTNASGGHFVFPNTFSACAYRWAFWHSGD